MCRTQTQTDRRVEIIGRKEKERERERERDRALIGEI